MKIAIDIRHLSSKNPSGVGHYSVRLIKEMAKLAPEHQFLLFAAGRSKTIANLPVFDSPNIEIITKKIPNRIIYLLLKLPLGLKLENFLSKKPDVWFFPNLNIIETDLPFALTVHDLSYKIYPEFFTKKTLLWHKIAGADKLFKKSNMLLAVSNSTKQDLVSKLKINPNKIFVTHLGVDSSFSPKQKPQDKNYLATYKIKFPYFLTLSTLEPRKNIESTIEAYSIWRASLALPPYKGGTKGGERSAPHLVIAGGRGWKYKMIEKNILNSKYKNDIHLIGYIKSKHRPALLRHAKALIFPSYYEGFGLPALEAMASGTPAITSFTGSMSEVVGNSAIMVDPYNISDIVQALEVLPEVTNKLEDRGIKQSSHFSWKKTAKKTLEVLQSLK